QATRDQDQIAPGKSMVEQREDRGSEPDDESHRAEQSKPQNKGAANADLARPRLMLLGKLVGEDRNKDQIVDAKNDLQNHEGDESDPGSGVVYKCKMRNEPIHGARFLRKALEHFCSQTESSGVAKMRLNKA